MSHLRFSNAAITSGPKISMASNNKGWFLAHITCPSWISCCTFFSLQAQGRRSNTHQGHATLKAEGRDRRQGFYGNSKIPVHNGTPQFYLYFMAKESYMVYQVSMDWRSRILSKEETANIVNINLCSTVHLLFMDIQFLSFYIYTHSLKRAAWKSHSIMTLVTKPKISTSLSPNLWTKSFLPHILLWLRAEELH